MINLYEDISEWNVEEKLHMPDSYGRKGMDVLKANEIQFTHDPMDATFGIWKDGKEWKDAPCPSKSILMCFEGPSRNPGAYLNSFQSPFAAVMQTVEDIGIKEYFVIPRSFNTIKEFFWKEKEKVLCFIGEDKQPTGEHGDLSYARRMSVGYWAARLKHHFNLYGKGWDMFPKSWRGEAGPKDNGICGYNIPSPVAARPVFWDKKYEIMSSHKFTLCMENTLAKGHITEKVFHAMCCGSIPIYTGDMRGKLIPEECLACTPMWETDTELEVKRANIMSWLMSEKAMAFSSVTFAETLCRVLRRIA
jgi:hypothetical protein